jgi:adenosine deaminase
MDYMAEYGIGIESSLTSNLQTSTVPNYASHPIRQFMDHGLLVTLNTDDPGISAIDLRHEYEVAAPAAGLTAAQIRQAQHNALAVAFLSPQERQALRTAKQPPRDDSETQREAK